MGKATKPVLPKGESALFRDAVRDAIPLEVPPRAPLVGKQHSPVAVQSLLDDRDALAESTTGFLSWEQSLETGEEACYLREGLGRDVIGKLRRGHWIVQDVVDLHGLNREEARRLLSAFFAACLKRGLRCVRVVHGKGLRSPNREPVLKGKVQHWLVRRNEVLAFCQAPHTQGGSGALLVLLRA
jgi:DNA-nicking Smr family endonuclease